MLVDPNRVLAPPVAARRLEPIAGRRVAIAAGSNLAIVNANAAIAAPAMRLGSRGFCGVATNLHPDLYAWAYRAPDTELQRELESFLVTAALSEAFGYPALAKIVHERLGTLASIRCRVIDYDVRERFWALDAIVDALMAGADAYRARIAAARPRARATA